MVCFVCSWFGAKRTNPMYLFTLNICSIAFRGRVRVVTVMEVSGSVVLALRKLRNRTNTSRHR